MRRSYLFCDAFRIAHGKGNSKGVGLRQNLCVKIVNGFMFSAGILLLVTSLAKIVGSFGKAELLKQPDPIFAFPFRDLMLISGIIELIIAGFCLRPVKPLLSLGLVFLGIGNFSDIPNRPVDNWMASSLLLSRQPDRCLEN